MPNEDDPRHSRPWDRGGRGRDGDDDRPRRRRDRNDDDDDDPPPRRRQRYGNDEDEYRPRRRARADASNGTATAGLILGVLSLCTVGLTAIPGLVCSLIALGKPTGRGIAIGGLVLNVLGALVGVGGMFYGVTKVREAAARMVDSNNMKRIGLGMHRQHSQAGGMSQYAQDPSGKVQTGASFRVGLLPFVEQDNLYRRFDLTQPWDAPVNRPVSDTPVKEYWSPLAGGTAANTPYRVFVGGGAMFNEDGRPVTLVNITDGTSNTIMMVHATEQVRWAEPRELPYSADAPLPSLGHPKYNGSNVLFADGSVRFVNRTIPERTMRLLITRADGTSAPGDF